MNKKNELTFETYKEQLSNLYNQDFKLFSMILISIEFEINDKDTLNSIFDTWLETDDANNSLLSDVIFEVATNSLD